MDYHVDKDPTTDEVLGSMDLSGKHVFVTGASAGLGLETCRALAVRGAHVVGTVRDVAKGREIIAPLTAGAAGTVELLELDLGSLESVRRCAEMMLKAGKPIDVLICNAGVMAAPQGVTADGFETQFGVNHLGHFLLVNLLLPLLRDGSRILVLSSMAHRMADIDLDDPNFRRKPYDKWEAYGAAKTANCLFAVELDKRLRARGIRAAAIHPGVVATKLNRHMPDEEWNAFEEAQTAHHDPHHRIKSIPEGAATTVWAGFVAGADEIGGHYCQDCGVPADNDAPEVPGAGPRAYAVDPDRAARLWQISEEMVGQTFNV